MKEIQVAIQTEDFCPDGCQEISPMKNRDGRVFCIYGDRCKTLWKTLKNAEKRADDTSPYKEPEAGA